MSEQFLYFLQQMFNGVTLGSTYALIAIGYTMVYGIIGMINFAHGEVYMIGSYVSVSYTHLGGGRGARGAGCDCRRAAVPAR